MEAQFAWDDKTVRQTFIRKVWLSRRRGTPARSAAQSSQRVPPPPPAGLRHPPSAAAGHGRHSCALFLLVRPAFISSFLGWKGDVSPFASTARLSGFTSRPTLACTWRPSEWKQMWKATPPHFLVRDDLWSVMCLQLHVLYSLHRAVLLRRAEVNLLHTNSYTKLPCVFFLKKLKLYLLISSKQEAVSMEYCLADPLCKYPSGWEG